MSLAMGETHIAHAKKRAAFLRPASTTPHLREVTKPPERYGEPRDPASRKLPRQTEFLREQVILRVAGRDQRWAVHDRERLIPKLVVVALHEQLPIRSDLVCEPSDGVPTGRRVRCGLLQVDHVQIRLCSFECTPAAEITEE